MLIFFLFLSFWIPLFLNSQEVDIQDQANVSPATEEDTLIVVYPAGIINLDPHKIIRVLDVQFHTAIYEGLVAVDPQTFQLRPALAERWEVSDGGKCYTFHLREGMRFSDGTPLDAYSFYRSFLRILDPNIPKEYSYLLDGVRNVLRYRMKRQGEISDLGLKVINAKVFKITLEYPIPYFLSLLAHHVFVPISSYQLPLMWTDYTRIAYSGPYIITGVTDQKITLSKNLFYWDQDSVKIVNLHIIKSDDFEKNTNDFLKGKVHWVLGPLDSNVFQGSSNIFSNIGFGTQFYYFSDRDPVLQNMRVREALFLLIPWDEIYALQVTPAHSLVPFLAEGLGYNKYRHFRTNRSKALKLLKQSGYPHGRGLPDLVIVTSSIYEQTAKLIASSWLGLKTGVRVDVPEGDYFEYLKEATPTLALSGWVADYLDPMAFLTLFVSNSRLNRSIYRDEKYDKLLFKSNLRRGKSRMRILAEAENLLLSHYVLVPINHSSSKNFINLTILKGWYNSPLNLHPFKYFSFDLNKESLSSVSLKGKDEFFSFQS